MAVPSEVYESAAFERGWHAGRQALIEECRPFLTPVLELETTIKTPLDGLVVATTLLQHLGALVAYFLSVRRTVPHA